MFSRGLSELVTISKSAIKLKCPPWMQDVSVAPVRGSLMLVTSAILTSLAVQFSASDEAVDPTAAPFPMLYSFCKQVLQLCADASAVSVSVAKTLRAKAVHQNRKSFLPFLKLINSLLGLSR